MYIVAFGPSGGREGCSVVICAAVEHGSFGSQVGRKLGMFSFAVIW